MGAPMAANLLKEGWQVRGWNRSPAAVRDLEQLGGTGVEHVAELREEPVIIFMLPDLPFIEEAAAGLLEAWRTAPPAPGTLLVVMSSVSPVAVRAFGRAVADASDGNASVLDAPVSGGTDGARRGRRACGEGLHPHRAGEVHAQGPVLCAGSGGQRRSRRAIGFRRR
ncbi:NAD(P)-binding domain-containing protein [Pseudarthrobacter sp. NPDC080039]|uniref:NAD(P)-binding domain-containing protein n=1 Tax=unclassified Pseudarthrobacter TaxID=2647000 RepID=UPI00344C6C4B